MNRDDRLRVLFAVHRRQWRQFRYVYPVISRRARGLSIGINLNPDGACNFDCVYCQVDRKSPRPVREVDLDVLAAELRAILPEYRKLFEEPEFRDTPAEYRRLNDIAFSGDGEPTASAAFPEAVRIAAAAKSEFGSPEAKIVIITNACFLTRPKVAEALAFLDQHNGQIWAKLDAGTEAYFKRVNRPSHSLQHVLDNIAAASRTRPIIIQSLFIKLDGNPPPPEELDAYVERLRWLGDQGGRIELVQVYTIARRPAERCVSALSPMELEAIAIRVRQAGIPAEFFA